MQTPDESYSPAQPATARTTTTQRVTPAAVVSVTAARAASRQAQFSRFAAPGRQGRARSDSSELDSTHPWVTDPSTRRGGYFQAGDGLFWTMPEQTDEELEELLGPHGWQITEWNKNGSATVIAYVGTDQGEGDDHETFCLLHGLGETQKWIKEADTNVDRLRSSRAIQVRELLDRGVSRYRIAGETGIPTTVVSRIAARTDEHAPAE